MLRAVFSRIFESRCIQQWIWTWGGRSWEDNGGMVQECSPVADMKGSKDGKERMNIGIGEDNTKKISQAC